jgi:hypothetical protein
MISRRAKQGYQKHRMAKLQIDNSRLARLLIAGLSQKISAHSGNQECIEVDSTMSQLFGFQVHPTLPLSGRQEL